MEQRISLITLGVSDLARSRAFYEALGWRGQEVQGTVFFQAGGLVMVLWGAAALAEDAGVAAGPTADSQVHEGFRGVALAQNVRTRDEVDHVVAAAEAAGGRITRAAADTFYGGYAGYFTDPDGHAWEIAFNPGFTLSPDGTVTVPDFGS